jgi:16S rRNA (uracil1498-N3)-methyltransferase
MGVKRIVPVSTARTVVKLESEKDEKKKVERWAKIAEEAAKQSGRGIIPGISMPMTLQEALKDAAKLDIVIVPYELEGSLAIKEVLRNGKSSSVGFFIGPEGGFEPYEIEEAKKMGAVPVTLGSRILRTETAGIAVLTGIMYEYDQIELFLLFHSILNQFNNPASLIRANHKADSRYLQHLLGCYL